MASAGDVNGDGFADVIVGENGYDSPSSPLINEGRAYLYLGSAAGPTTGTSWSAQSNQSDARLGESVAYAGDVNGDGYGDVVVGAFLFDNGQSNEGSAFLYLGSPTGPEATATWSAESDQTDGQMGSSVSTAGDVNADGFADVLVGAKGYDDGEVNEGRVYCFLGSAAGLEPVASWTAESDQASAEMGDAVSTAGDVDGDGYDDVIVASPQFDDGETNEGRAWLFRGSASGLEPTADWTIESNQTDAKLGGGVAGAGDVNEDGYADVLVGVPNYTNGESLEGQVRLYLGSPSGLEAVPAWTSEGNQANARFGFSVAAAGDVDGDGYGDALIGAKGWTNPENSEGATFLYLGDPTGLSPSATWTFESDQASALLGYSVSSAGDVNGDGFADLVAGAMSYTASYSTEGRSYLFLGSDSGPAASPDWTFDGGAWSAWSGGSVAAGDLNGDGYSDLIIGAQGYTDGEAQEGATFVFLGNGGDGTTSAFQPLATALHPSTTTPISPGLRSSATDSFDLTAFARSAHGRTGLKLQAEVKPLGTPFDGSGLVEPSAWTDTGLTGASLQETIDSLDPETGYHWRARFLFDPADAPPALWSRWLWGGHSGHAEGTHVVTACALDSDADGLCDSSDLDDDGDGEPDATDCDPLDPSAWPGAPETCDAVDSDCDGDLVDEFDDTDGDLEPDCIDLDDDGDGDPDTTDCADLDPSVFTGAPEACDTLDSDCDGDLVDEFDDTDGDDEPDCTDPDDDGDGDPDTTDCANLDDSIYTGAPEIPDDSVDQDCNGFDTVTCFEDLDGDTYGSNATVLAADGDCVDVGESLVDTDCDDGNASTWPGAPEACDGVDSDCDGSLVDDFDDTDGDDAPDCIDEDDDDDGFDDASDCGPLDPAIFPGAPESCDGVDSDCDGDLVDGDPDSDGDGVPDCVDEDVDGDGFDAASDCDDDDASVYPGAPEITGDGIDQDCNGFDTVTCFVDVDGDTFGSAATQLADDGDCLDPGESLLDTDCDDGDAAVFPGAPETVGDGIDQDCNGFDSVSCFVDADGDTFGSGTTLVADDGDCLDAGESDLSGDCDDGEPTVFPGAPEVPDDGIDQDCDGFDTVTCFVDADGDTFGSSATLLSADGDCIDAGEATSSGDCDDGDAGTWPGAPETPDDGIDQDCSGFDTVSCWEDLDGDTFGSSVAILSADGDCTDAGETASPGDCDDGEPFTFPGAPEACDTLDSDCDGDLVDVFADTDADGDPDCTDDDDDGDLFDDVVDCDPLDPTVYPLAPESCDGVDSNCDGDLVDDFDDTDADGIPDCVDVDLDGDGFQAVNDCDDGDAAVFPGAAETPDDGIDQDCNGADTVTCHVDGDGDTWGGPTTALADDGECTDPGESDTASDCDDASASVYPGAAEVPDDGIDQDCSGADTVTCQVDNDADGFGSTATLLSVDGDCDDPGESDLDTDCDDSDAAVNPGVGDAGEACDWTDADCDGDLVDGFDDTDGDGTPDCIESDSDGDGDPDDTDCAPLDDTIFDGAAEIPDDGIDQDCDGFDTVTCFEDLDEDGFGSVETVLVTDGDCDDPGVSDLATDCDDGDAAVFPGAEEVCNGGVDDDCEPDTDEAVDGDGDGFAICDGDCDDDEEAVFPGAEEVCDGLDNDCDPDTVEDDADADGDGHRVCDGDCDDDDELVYPDAPELCDDIDNDCDGDADEELEYIDWYADIDGDSFGDDEATLSDCAQPDGYVATGDDCDDTDPEIHPGADEVCDGLDNDCDPLTDLDGTDQDADGDGVLACAGDCDDADPGSYPGAAEVCDDAIDQDCDGTEASGEDPECWTEGCSDCSGALAPGGSAPALLLLAWLTLLCGRRRGEEAR